MACINCDQQAKKLGIIVDKWDSEIDGRKQEEYRKIRERIYSDSNIV